MTNRGFEETQSTYLSDDPRSLIGQFRNLGPDGPAYEIMSIDDTSKVMVEVVYSGEKVTFALAEVLEDPIAETIP